MSGDTRGGRPVRPHRSGGSGIKQDPAPGPSAVPYWQQAVTDPEEEATDQQYSSMDYGGVGHVPDQEYETCACSGPYGPDRLCAACDGTGVVPVDDPADPDEEQ